MLWNRYVAVDTLVFPLIRVKGDVERLGMEAIKPATNGAPTVAFPVRGLVDAVADGVSGSFVQEGDYSTFADAVASICHDGPPHGAACRSTHLSLAGIRMTKNCSQPSILTQGPRLYRGKR